MSSPEWKRRINKGNILLVTGIIILLIMIGVVFRIFWYKRQCDIIYNEVNSSIVESEMKLYAEYMGQKVQISRPNINRIINSITDRLVYFTSEKEMPEEDPIVLEFGDVLFMEVYPAEGYEVFVKHSTDEKTEYYIIKNTCSFKQLKKMVSVDEWSSPNILIEN